MYHQGNKPRASKTSKSTKKPSTTTTTFHKATCGSCGSHCQVPFRPSGTKPVLCNNCFQNPKSAGEKPQKAPMRKMMTADQFETLNTKLDKILARLQ